MNVKAFFVAALSSALELGVATPEDVLRHVTSDVLAQHLPRPLWARLLTACLGAPRVDAQLVVETIGVPNLCEYVPSPVIWACLAEIGRRSLGDGVVLLDRPIGAPTGLATGATATAPASGPAHAAASSSAATTTGPIERSRPLAPPPPPAATPPQPTPVVPAALGPSIPAPNAANPLADIVADIESDDRAGPRGRTPPSQRFRQSSAGIGRLAANNTRRPQAAASPSASPLPSVLEPSRARRGQTEADAYDVVTEVAKTDDWKHAHVVEDEQLVDWQVNDETSTGEDYNSRKR